MGWVQKKEDCGSDKGNGNAVVPDVSGCRTAICLERLTGRKNGRRVKKAQQLGKGFETAHKAACQISVHPVSP